ncbi:hypothetical protein GCM10007298_38740 [Williamsia phyllosphaerae]|uniref:CopG-like ribbon-helix-helix domain-containing protein n=1 Tax=Williamsia phyllosphaerae TaxID=885042 RepID=A0ABQ1V517_9NOCA|nr:hypothetical protein GCM10007298_38740 [Williamsia phyllosphaerae]
MTPATVPSVPNKPKTPLRTFRIPDDVYGPAKAAAEANGETVTDVVKKALVNYTRRHKRDT